MLLCATVCVSNCAEKFNILGDSDYVHLAFFSKTVSLVKNVYHKELN